MMRYSPMILLMSALATSAAIQAPGAAAEPSATPEEPGSQAAPNGDELLRIAWEAQTAGDLDVAEDRYREALTRFEEEGDTRGIRLVSINLGLLLSEMDRLDDAVGLLRRAVDLSGGAVDRSVPVATRLLLVDVFVDHGRPVEALGWADAALVAAAASGEIAFVAAPAAAYLRTSRAVDADDATTAGALRHMDGRLADLPGYEGIDSLPMLVFSRGVAALEAGDATRALVHMEDAAAAAAAMGTDDPDLLVGLAFVALQVGDDRRARAALDRGLSLEGGRTVPLLSSQAALQWREGWYAVALQTTREALERARDEGDIQLTAELEIVLAARLETVGELDEARRIHEAAVERLEGADELGVETDALVHQRLRLALVDARLGRWEEASRQASRSLAENRDPFQQAGRDTVYGSRAAAAGAFTVIAWADLHHGDGEEAPSALKAAATLSRPDPAAAAALGYLALTRGDADGAAEVFTELEEAGFTSWFAQHGQGMALWRQGHLDEAAVALAEAVAGLEGATPAGHMFLPTSLQVHADLIDLLIEQGDLPAAFAATCRARAGAVEAMDVPDLVELQQSLPEDASALLYLVAPEEVLIWVVAPGWLAVHREPRTRPEVEAMVAALHAEVAAPPRGSRRLARAWRTPAADLHAALIGPVADQLKDSPVLVVMPHGALTELPFSTLIDEDTDEALIQRHTLITATGTRLLTSRSLQLPRKPAALLVGDAQGTSSVSQLARLFRKPRVLDGDSAIEDLLVGQITTAEVIHLHTPCDLNGVSPRSSRLVLGPDAMNDGVLTAHDVATLPLQAPLVTLVGCADRLHTGAQADPHVLRPAPARLVLAGAFVEAGAPTVLVGLWPTEPPHDLYDPFYAHAGRLGPAAALQRAQSRMFAEEVHPYHWGGWVVLGGL